MLQSLLKIGKWQSEDKSEWDRFFDIPAVKTEDGRGNPIRNYILPVIFDLDESRLIVESENLKEYDVREIKKIFPLKIKGGNNKAIYISAPALKVNQIYKTFFGKEGDTTENGQLLEAIDKLDSSLLTPELNQTLSKIFKLKDQFLQISENPDNKNVDINTLTKSFNLSGNEKVVFVTIEIISTDLGYPKPISFAAFPPYIEFLKLSYFGNHKKKTNDVILSKLCYASGEITDNVEALSLNERYSLNKMFVTETKNYATLFDKNRFFSNYQVSVQNQEYLDYASKYLLHEGFKVKIAGLDHVIIPEFLSSSEIDLQLALEGINRKSDILFNLNKLDNLTRTVQEELDDQIFWINYVAFDSDGNFFKSTGLIKDVSNFHLDHLLNLFSEIDWSYNDAEFVEWNKVMTDYDYESKEWVRRNLNFNTFFRLIPLRKEKEKKNKALDLFKSILEERNIRKELLYEYFCELILCHWYERYNSYTNVKKYNPDSFYFAARDSVFQYHALFQLLRNLKLIDMNEPTQTEENSINQYDQAIEGFFTKMNFTPDQKAMFYLGRMLNKVEYIQKGKTKTVIQKVNFNGMDKEDIQRLRIGLIEKAKQYNAMGKVIFIDKNFGELFNYNNWDMNPKEAVFFILTGYSFGVGSKEAEELEEKETIEIN